ncbi:MULTISPECIES: glycoside hydrolase family 127 protein [unclassified Nesterenkonia]|uniref:glycoside hydrolase family 127 protein n=1 Tax=unclassified Nesterenkonia TaxID=2629769 RepID=UPI001F4D17B7|nr:MULTISPECIES: beta-L-arabinofuranosidase domain-containing protein [unclassified Nesterenkonia]MCH8559231.1 glycoside hydrolase family 127 protein [Nesterenkonia sp. DZ6]MCH8571576.1 glycoside hydrolase family 127 protein [Nesterenkonia sp. AY15]
MAQTPQPRPDGAITGLVPTQSPVPVAPSQSHWQPLPLTDIEFAGGFWGHRQSLNHNVTLPHIEEWIERSGWAKNFDHAGTGELPGKRQGREFSDSEIYKLLEGMAWEIARTGDQDLDRRFKQLATRVAKAQESDGYINTNFGRPGQAPRYSDFEWGHELYCYGHLIQAGVARARTHGVDQLVEIAIGAADHICAEFGSETDTRLGGHPEVETALVELYRVTSNAAYLRQAQLFVARRGQGHLGEIDFGPSYFQDDIPVREASVLRGHAVRALYLGSGAVDVAVETEDESLLESVQTQMINTLSRRTYITGGMGAHHEGESFGQDYELPADRAYAESCAGVASVQLNHRLLLSTGDARHGDAIERTLYNIIATAVGADGRSFFYTNTLHHREEGDAPAAEEASPRAASSSRAPWYQVSCCPTNLTRTLASLGAYMATKSDQGVQIHQYFSGALTTELKGGSKVSLQLSTEYPRDSRIEIQVLEAPAGEWTLDLRVPEWADSATLSHSGAEPVTVDPGYVRVTGSLRPGSTLILDIPVQARWTRADPRIDAVRGQVAVEQGPLVMAMESVDLRSSVPGADISGVRVDTSELPVQDGAGTRVATLIHENQDLEWPYFSPDMGTTESRDSSTVERPRHDVALVAYHEWANRGPSTMRVWIPEA